MPSSNLYHERQRLALCGVHAVNNLLQQKKYSKADFDAVCLQLDSSTWFNRHRSFLGIGNYDVNVVTLLLQQENYTVQWHDQRNTINVETLQQHQHLTGILWNVPANSLLGRLTGGRHWIALLWDQENGWINLDSGLHAPNIVGAHENCVKLLTLLANKESHILLVSANNDE